MGGGNPLKVLKDVALNVSTGGLYGLAKGVEKVASGKLSAGALDALANQGPSGNVLTPALGTTNSLALQAAVAGASAAAAPSGTFLGTTAAEAAGGASTAAVPSIVAGTGAVPLASSNILPAALVAAAAAGTAGSVLAHGRYKTPPLPGAPTPQSLDTAAQDAANAVQTADAEARRQRARKRQSSVLGGYQGSTQVGLSPATLQPAPARKSVLG